MNNTPALLVTIRAQSHLGENILGSRWFSLIKSLHDQLAQDGIEHHESSDELLIFSIEHGLSTFPILLSALTKTKEMYDWKSSSGPVPIQIIMDIISDEQTAHVIPPENYIWGELEQESIYITTSLRKQWENLLAGLNEFPEHQFQQKNVDYHQVIFSDYDTAKWGKLFTCRSLPTTGDGSECFYCGMTSHHPSMCPCKHLSMETWGLGEAGYLTITEISDLYQTIFPKNPAIEEELKEGVRLPQLRKRKDLLIFVSYFDLFAIFQPRFLRNFCFSGHANWDDIYRNDNIKIDNQNLNLALDCLRVRQYEQAKKLLINETERRDGDRLNADIALAFWSLEQDRIGDMGRYLEEARIIATHSWEITYCNLLLSRYYELQNVFWEAKEAITLALKSDFDCLDVQYRRIQLAVRDGLSNRDFKKLRSLIIEHNEFFMTALLDPTFLPVQGLIEEILIKQFNTVLADAEKNLALAKNEFDCLEPWLTPEEPQREEFVQSLEQLTQQLERTSYYDILEVVDRSRAIIFTCNKLRTERSEHLKKQLERQKQQLNGGYLKFWKDFGLKSLFKEFQIALANAVKKNQRATQMLEGDDREAIEEALHLAKQLNEDSKSLKKMYERMLWVSTLFDGLKVFTRNIAICEISIIALLLLVFLLVSSTLSDILAFSWWAELLSNKAFQRRTLFFSSTVIAPFIAVVWTAIERQKK